VKVCVGRWSNYETVRYITSPEEQAGSTRSPFVTLLSGRAQSGSLFRETGVAHRNTGSFNYLLFFFTCFIYSIYC